MPREELTLRPMDVTFAISPQPHVGPFLGKHEELFRIHPGQPRGREVADQVAQGTGGRLAGIDPSAKRHDHRCQVSGRLAVKLYMVHVHPLGSGERRSPPYASKARSACTWCPQPPEPPTGPVPG